MSSTTEVAAPGAAALAAGDLAGSPSGSSHAVRSRASPGAAGAATGSDDVGTLPSVDGEACGRAARYPRDAEENGIEGDVRLRVSLNERGAVSAVRVLSGPGHGLEEAAAEAIRHRCKFSPAIARNGQARAFVIESYTFHFELPR
jgi:protein TonB